jgi:hypothetical protein
MLLLKGSVVKAIVLSLSRRSPRTCHTPLFYSGNYTTSKLLLNRLSWPGKPTCSFEDFGISYVYKAIMSTKDSSIKAFLKWESAAPNHTFHWKQIIAYIHDPILDGRSRQLLYKICTRTLIVGTKIRHYGHSELCECCDKLHIEDIFHCFLYCPRLQQLWERFDKLVSTACITVVSGRGD